MFGLEYIQYIKIGLYVTTRQHGASSRRSPHMVGLHATRWPQRVLSSASRLWSHENWAKLGGDNEHVQQPNHVGKSLCSDPGHGRRPAWWTVLILHSVHGWLDWTPHLPNWVEQYLHTLSDTYAVPMTLPSASSDDWADVDWNWTPSSTNLLTAGRTMKTAACVGSHKETEKTHAYTHIWLALASWQDTLRVSLTLTSWYSI